MLLSRAGLRVLVVERARRGSDTLSTHALMRGGVLQLQRGDLLRKVVEAGTPPVPRVTFHYGAEVMPVTLKPYAGVEALYAPRRTVLDTLLVEAAEEAGANVRFGVAVTGLLRDGTGRVVGVVTRDQSGITRTERAALVVGADGRHSLVAEQAAATTVDAGSHAAAYLYGYWSAGHVDGYHWYYGDGLSAGIIPTNDGLACVFVAGPSGALGSAMRHGSPVDVTRTLSASVDDSLAALTSGTPTGGVRYYRGMQGRLRRAHGRGWALVGDAGWWKDPLSTHGITDALRDAELLARAVLEGAGSDAVLRIALGEYEKERDRIARMMNPVVDRLASHRWDLTEAHGLLRTLSSAMAEDVDAIRSFDDLPARTA